MTTWAVIESLPDEVLNQIFSYLNAYEIKLKVALVSKRWNALSQNSKLIKKLEFGPSLSTETICRILTNFPSIGDLKFFSRRDINDILTEITLLDMKLTRFKTNSSRDSRLTDIATDILLDFLRTCTCLKSLTVKRCTFDEPEAFFKHIGTVLPNVKFLNINHNQQLGSEQLDDLVAGLRPVEDMRIYCLSFNRIGSVTPYTDGPVLRLLSKMSDTLSVLKLNMLGLSDVVMQRIPECSHLKVLHMYRVVNIQDEGLLQIKRLPLLERLVVTVPRAITIRGWRTLFSQDNMQRLKELTVSNSYAVDDSVALTIAGTCQILEKLSLPGCRKMTNDGITEIMKACQNLNYLNLFSTRSCVAETFPYIPQLLPNLKTLIYRPVDKRNIQAFANLSLAMPSLQTSSVYRYL